jgi:Outer membrane lipoprotein-sorting protein
MKRNLLLLMTGIVTIAAYAQKAENLILRIKEKLDKVKDYEARGTMKMNVDFIKAPVANVKVYFKKPDKLKIINEGGISLVPKGSINININNIIGDISASDVIDGGRDSKTGFRIIKLVPKDDNANVVLSILHIDEQQLVVRKMKTTTKENGTYEMDLVYGRYADYGLADKVVFSFNTKGYKLPKGVALDYDESKVKPTETDKKKDNMGVIELNYSNYSINKGVPDSIFK